MFGLAWRSRKGFKLKEISIWRAQKAATSSLLQKTENLNLNLTSSSCWCIWRLCCSLLRGSIKTFPLFYLDAYVLRGFKVFLRWKFNLRFPSIYILLLRPQPFPRRNQSSLRSSSIPSFSFTVTWGFNFRWKFVLKRENRGKPKLREKWLLGAMEIGEKMKFSIWVGFWGCDRRIRYSFSWYDIDEPLRSASCVYS